MQITSIFKVTVSVVELTLLSKKGHAISDLQMTKWLVPMYPLSGGSTVHTIWMLYSTCISIYCGRRNEEGLGDHAQYANSVCGLLHVFMRGLIENGQKNT